MLTSCYEVTQTAANSDLKIVFGNLQFVLAAHVVVCVFKCICKVQQAAELRLVLM